MEAVKQMLFVWAAVMPPSPGSFLATLSRKREKDKALEPHL
jgi:hypothetical protein